MPIPHGGGGMPEHSGCRGAGGMSPETVSGSGWVVVAGCSLQHLEAKLQAGKKSLKPFLSWCLFKGFFQPLHLKQKQEHASGQLITQLPRANRVLLRSMLQTIKFISNLHPSPHKMLPTSLVNEK